MSVSRNVLSKMRFAAHGRNGGRGTWLSGQGWERSSGALVKSLAVHHALHCKETHSLLDVVHCQTRREGCWATVERDSCGNNFTAVSHLMKSS